MGLYQSTPPPPLPLPPIKTVLVKVGHTVFVIRRRCMYNELKLQEIRMYNVKVFICTCTCATQTLA